MNFAEINTATATIDERESFRLFAELLITKEFRCYGPQTPQLGAWCDRFMTSHATIPGIVTQTMNSSLPIHVLRFWSEDRSAMTEGVVYLNGAVLRCHQAHQPEQDLLFVADDTATMWGYPDNNYVLFGGGVSEENT